VDQMQETIRIDWKSGKNSRWDNDLVLSYLLRMAFSMVDSLSLIYARRLTRLECALMILLVFSEG
jgi:hypothetical protein